MTPRFPILSSLRLRRVTKRAAPPEDDMGILAPVAELLEEARPGRGLLADIESELDGGEIRRPVKTDHRSARRLWMAAFLSGALAATLLGSGIQAILREDQYITVRPAESEGWLALGSVILKGATLRKFVATKCKGNSHLVIDLSAYDGGKTANLPKLGTRLDISPVMAPEEKILMECIF